MGPNWRVIGFVIIWYLIAEANAVNRALIFNYKKQSFISLPKNLSNVSLNCDYWVTACPAKDKDEEDFNVENSVYNNATFLKNIYSVNSRCSDLHEAVCDKPFETSMMYSGLSKKYEFGYEVFHEASKLPNISAVSFYNCYPIKKFQKNYSRFAIFQSYKKVFMDVLERKRSGLLLREVKMEFLWIPLFKVKLDALNFRNVEYEIRKNNINPMLPCQDYSLGNEMWDSKEVDTLYSNEIQEIIFDGVKIPIRTEESEEVPEGACEPKYNCLTKWPLLPTDQFQFASDSPLKCSNITTVPIWKSTLEKIMAKMDKYLYVLQRISGQPLRVLAGVDQTLNFQTSYWFTKDINLQQKSKKFKIIAPKIIYKMVKFKLNPCKNGENCWYGIMIVIHNGPYFNKKDLICDDAEYQTGELGWEEIRYDTWSYKGARSKFIYVCPISKEIMESVGLTYTKNTIYQPLSLLKFPRFDKDKQKVIFKSLKEDVFNEMVRLDKSGAVVELDDGLIERPSIDDNFGSADGDEFVYKYDEETSNSGDSDPEK